MNKQTIIKNILTIYGKYGVTQEDIEPLIDGSVKDGFTYDRIYFFLQLAITDAYGLDFFWCTARQMARALGTSDERMLEIIKETSKELETEEYGLDDPFRVPVEVGEKFFMGKGKLYMDELQMISSSDWQDCYRIMDGYLFVVNKFVEVDDMRTTYTIPKNYYRRVDQKAKGKLWILTRPIKRYGGYKNYELLEPNEENGEFPVGTVFYNEKPVRKTDDPRAYDCFVKASWNCLHNDLKDWKMISEQIQKIIKKYLEG